MFLSQPRPGGSFLTRVSLWLVLLIAGIFSYAPVMAQVDPAVMGQWSSPESWPTVSIHTHLLPTGKVMFFYHGDIIGLWDPATDTLTSLGTSSYNIFCSGHSFLADGRLLVTGGHIDQVVGLPNASIYDPADDSWTALPNMNAGRWYPTSTTLANGDVLVTSGSIDNTIGHNRLPQVWQMATSSWRDLTGAQLTLPLYPWMHLAPNGKVFNSGPITTTRYLNTSATGSWAAVANQTTLRDYGSSVMYDNGKVFIVGGHDPPTQTAEVINLNAASPSWRTVSSMSTPRRQINATLLPDGKVLVTGGSSAAGFNNPAGAVLYAEMWDPVTESWTMLAGHERYRGYHSVAVLLPDGRVLSSGGDGEPNAEVYSPPYLFKGPRPTINSAPTQVGYGQTFFVDTPDGADITQVNWIRIASVTHAFNQNQVINHLSYVQAEGGLNIISPSSRNLCPPGHYMLFAVNSNGVPSVARFVQIVMPANPSPATPTDLTATASSSSTIVLQWTDNDINESGFRIERSSDGGNLFAPITTVGADTTGYTDGNLSPQTTYYYRVVAYNGGGDSEYSNTANATTLGATTGGGTGSLTGNLATPVSPINLTSEGTTDWAHWGLNTATSFDHKAGVVQQISNYSSLGTVNAKKLASNPTAFSWSDGAPTTSATNTKTGVFVIGLNKGFQVTVPADTANRTLRVYVGLWKVQGKLEATLSDGSAAALTDTSLDGPSGTKNGLYTVNYRAGSSGQTLTLKYTARKTYDPNGNVTLEAATLVNNSSDSQSPSVPTNLELTSSSSTSVTLSWTAATDDVGVTGYQIFRGTTLAGTSNTTNYSDSGLNPGTNYTYTVKAYDGAGNLSVASSPLSVTTVGNSSGGSLTGNLATPVSPINLTTEGTTDWAHWGLNTATSFDHRAGVVQQISNYFSLGTVNVKTLANNPTAFSWSDGTPTTSATNTKTGVFVIGLNKGFQVTVPADTASRTLRVYVGLWKVQGKLEATLSDGSAPALTDTSLDGPSGTKNGVYTVNYRTASSGQTLTLKYTASKTYDPNGNVTLEAATLQ